MVKRVSLTMRFFLFASYTLNAMEISAPISKPGAKEETDEAFKHRLVFISQNWTEENSCSSIETSLGTLIIDYWGSLKLTKRKKICCIPYTRNRYLIDLPHKNRFEMAEKIECIAVANNTFLAALSKTSSLHIMADVYLTRLFIYDLVAHKKKVLKITNLPAEKIYTAEEGTIKKLLEEGYEHEDETAKEEILENEYAHIAVSPNGQLVAIANTTKVYVAQEDQKGIWQDFRLVKKVSVPTGGSNTHKIVRLMFNDQGNKLGIIYQKEDSREVELLEFK